jgi:hypothetical protein
MAHIPFIVPSLKRRITNIGGNSSPKLHNEKKERFTEEWKPVKSDLPFGEDYYLLVNPKDQSESVPLSKRQYEALMKL